mgnify:CR=1 FL=1
MPIVTTNGRNIRTQIGIDVVGTVYENAATGLIHTLGAPVGRLGKFRINEQWKEYKFVLDKARKGTDFFFQFSGYDTSVLFDDIEIKFLDPKVTPPVASAHSDFHLKGFTANWEAVEGAAHTGGMP